MADKPGQQSRFSSTWHRVFQRLRPNANQQNQPDKTTPTPSRITDVARALKIWTEQQHMSNQQHSTRFLEQQLQDYERSVERRRQRLLEEMKSTVFAVSGVSGQKYSTGKRLLSTDDSLPYEPKPLKFGGGKENKFDPKHDNRSSYSNRDGSYFDSVSISSISSSSSSSGSSTEDEGESTGQLADLLKSIVEDSENATRTKSQKDLKPDQLMVLSHNDNGEFEKLMKENTKEALFLSQPTLEESSNWCKRRIRQPGQDRCPYPVMFTSNSPEEILTFCNVCKPRRYTRWIMKKSRR